MQLGASWSTLGLTMVATAAVFASVLLLTRLYGLRAFAKIAPFDFAATIAIGSLFATTAAGAVPLAQGLVALGTLYLVQRVLARSRRAGVKGLLDNEPMLLMAGDRVLHENLATGNITEDDLVAKLREANVLDKAQIRAVVLESTGDIAVLHGEAGGTPLSRELLQGVRGLDVLDELPACWSVEDVERP